MIEDDNYIKTNDGWELVKLDYPYGKRGYFVINNVDVTVLWTGGNYDIFFHNNPNIVIHAGEDSNLGIGRYYWDDFGVKIHAPIFKDIYGDDVQYNIVKEIECLMDLFWGR